VCRFDRARSIGGKEEEEEEEEEEERCYFTIYICDI
jgi:hypothetical protein